MAKFKGNESGNVIFGTEGGDIIRGLGGDDTLRGDKGNDRLFGGEASDKLYGGAGVDVLHGGQGDDILEGDQGDDVLIGGRGLDQLYGDTGKDTFVFALGDSGKTDETADNIHVFVQRQGDLIDLTAVSEKIGQTLTFIGFNAFTHTVGEVRYTADDSDLGHSLIEIDVTGDGQADMAIRTGGGVNVHFTAADFVF